VSTLRVLADVAGTTDDQGVRAGAEEELRRHATVGVAVADQVGHAVAADVDTVAVESVAHVHELRGFAGIVAEPEAVEGTPGTFLVAHVRAVLDEVRRRRQESRMVGDIAGCIRALVRQVRYHARVQREARHEIAQQRPDTRLRGHVDGHVGRLGQREPQEAPTMAVAPVGIRSIGPPVVRRHALPGEGVPARAIERAVGDDVAARIAHVGRGRRGGGKQDEACERAGETHLESPWGCLVVTASARRGAHHRGCCDAGADSRSFAPRTKCDVLSRDIPSHPDGRGEIGVRRLPGRGPWRLRVLGRSVPRPLPVRPRRPSTVSSRPHGATSCRRGASEAQPVKSTDGDVARFPFHWCPG